MRKSKTVIQSVQDGGINCAKLAIRARSRPIFRRCSIFIRPTLAELSDADDR